MRKPPCNLRHCIRTLIGTIIACLFLGLTACAPNIDARIAQRQDAFDAYPEAVQTRLRRGQIRLGDDTDAVWIVYGDPTEKVHRVDTKGRTDVWIYKILGYHERLYPTVRPVYHDVRGSIRGSYYFDDTPEYEWQEVLRVEFINGHVSAIQQTE